MAVEAQKASAGGFSAGRVLDSSGYLARDLATGTPLDLNGLPVSSEVGQAKRNVPDCLLVSSRLPIGKRLNRGMEGFRISFGNFLERMGDAISGC